jgi:hypothetical protein
MGGMVEGGGATFLLTVHVSCFSLLLAVTNCGYLFTFSLKSSNHFTRPQRYILIKQNINTVPGLNKSMSSNMQSQRAN